MFRLPSSKYLDIHKPRIVHNDISAANVHVFETGWISLVEFGLSICPSNEEFRQKDCDTLNNMISYKCLLSNFFSFISVF